MPRPSTGSVEWHSNPGGEGGHWDARIRFADGVRGRECMEQHTSRTEAGQTAAKRQAAKWQTEARVKKLAARSGARPTETETVEQWGTRWCDMLEHKGRASADGYRSNLRNHIAPVIGHEPIATVSRASFEKLVSVLDDCVAEGEFEAKTALNIWAVARAMMRDASKGKDPALRVRNDNPCADVSPPEPATDKVKGFLYPSEFATLASCELVPRWRRRLYAGVVYGYMRIGEAAGLTWADVDLEHGSLHIHQQLDNRTGKLGPLKTRQARRAPIEAALLPLLRAMWRKAPRDEFVFRIPKRTEAARTFRDDLRAAGITRTELFESGPTRCHIKFHDLRATGVTWAIVRGDDSVKVQHRAGHADLETTLVYVRETHTIGTTFGLPFPTLPTELLGEALPAEAPVPALVEPQRMDPGMDLNDDPLGKLQRAQQDSNL